MPGKGPAKGRQRKFFFLHVSNVLGIYDVSIGYRTTKGVIQPLSACRQSASVKIPFGPVNSCEFRERNVGVEETVKEFKFVNNRSQTVALQDSLLNNLEFKVHDFSRKVTEMFVEKKKNLLAIYVSMINNTENFVNHRDEFHDPDGFQLNGGGVSKASIVAAGGSLEEIRQFVKAAKESALMVESAEKSLEEIAKNVNPSRKHKASTEVPFKHPKLSRTEIVVEKEKEELEDLDGLEKDYQNSLMGVAHVSLENISVSQEMQVKVNPFRVQFIMASMRKRYDPAISVLVVCPVDQDSYCDGKNVDDNKFYVVQKVKCLIAFQELDKTGEFVKLSGHQNRKVLVYILNNNRPELMQYGNARENYISAQFVRKTVPQDLLHHFHSLTMTDSSVKALKVVERMARLCCIGPDECTALDKLCKWSNAGFVALMEVIDSFEKYKTLDVKKTGHQQRLARGDKLNMSNVLLRLLSKCPEHYFISNYGKVLDATMSLKDLAENYKEVLEVDKVYKVLCVIANYGKVETLLEKYPGMFDFQKMKNYVGAVFNSKMKNLKAIQLQNYYDYVVNSHVKDFENPVNFISFETAAKLFEDEGMIYRSDMIVYMMKDKNHDIVMSIISAILGGEKSFQAALLVFPTEMDHFEAISYLRSQQAATNLIKDFKVVPLLFKKESKSCEEVCENVSYALLFGKLTILNSPLMVHYCDLVHLIKVVENICPPQLNVSLVCDPGIPFIKLHSQDLDKKVTYYGIKSEITKFKNKLDADKTPVIEPVNGESVDSEDIPSTSTTPAKSSPENLNDSGFAQTPQSSSTALRSLSSQMAEIERDI